MSRIPSSYFRTLLIVATDLGLWALIVTLSVIVEGFVVVRLLHVPLSRALHGGEPLVWAAQFFQPLIALPLLTLLLRWRGEGWSNLGLKRPLRWRRFVLQVTAGLFALLVAGYLIRHLVIAPLHLNDTGAVSMSGLRGNVSAFMAALVFAVLGAGLNEELQFRGFIQERLTRAFGTGRAASYLSLAATGIFFGLAHTAMGPANVVYAALGGIVVGLIYLWSDRNLWVVVIVHSLFDVLRLIQFFRTGADLPI